MFGGEVILLTFGAGEWTLLGELANSLRGAGDRPVVVRLTVGGGERAVLRRTGGGGERAVVVRFMAAGAGDRRRAGGGGDR